jgi:hypothetical protein
MVKAGFYKYYNELPPWGKAATIIGIGAAAYFIYQKVSDSVSKKNAILEAKKTLSDINSEIKVLNNKGMKPNYSDSQYKLWADRAFVCYSGWGTCRGDTIFVNMKNDYDVLKLIEAFGIRTIPSGRLNPAPDFTGNLPQVMSDELSTSDIAQINKVLEKNGVTYKF